MPVSKKTKIWLTTLAIVIILVGAGLIGAPFIFKLFFEPTGSRIPAGQSLENINLTKTKQIQSKKPEIVAQNLTIPWELVFLPDGDMLVTQRSGELLRIGADRRVIRIKGVEHRGEGGLLGLALDPDYKNNQQIYLYLTTKTDTGLINRVERYRLNHEQLKDRTTIIDGIPGASFHDGGRIAFGPDGLLYIATGEAGHEELAQDLNSLAGKILRLNPDGSVPADNPYKNAIYSYGHRNPQGLAWDSQGRLWATEHGPSGLAPNSGQDELNLIEKGANYGWPKITGAKTAAGLKSPIAQSGITETWAPSGIVYLNGSLFFAGLRGESLYQAKIIEKPVPEVELTAHFRSDFGRLRSVSLGPDGKLYLLTNNTDGRGSPRPDDDKIIAVDPASLL